MIDPNTTNRDLILLIFISIISADNLSITEDEKQEVMRRYNDNPDNWGYIFEAIKDKKLVDSLVELMEQLNTEDDGDDPLGLFE